MKQKTSSSLSPKSGSSLQEIARKAAWKVEAPWDIIDRMHLELIETRQMLVEARARIYSDTTQMLSLQEAVQQAAGKARGLRREITKFFSHRTPSFVEAPMRGSEEGWLDSKIAAALQSVAQPLEVERDQWKRRAIENENGCNILEERVASLQKDLDWTRDNAAEHCGRADTAEAAVGANCRTISDLQASIQLLKEKHRKEIEERVIEYGILREENFTLRARIKELEAKP